MRCSTQHILVFLSRAEFFVTRHTHDVIEACDMSQVLTLFNSSYCQLCTRQFGLCKGHTWNYPINTPKLERSSFGSQFRRYCWILLSMCVLQWWLPNVTDCSYCQELEPVWNELGDTFKNEDSVLVCKIDASVKENAIPGGYPLVQTLKLQDTLSEEYQPSNCFLPRRRTTPFSFRSTEP